MPKLTDDIFDNYVKTKKDKDFNIIYKSCYSILLSSYHNNDIFKNRDFVLDFNDVFQLSMIKLFKYADKFNPQKGRITSFVFQIFKNTLRDEIRKKKLSTVPLNNSYTSFDNDYSIENMFL